MREFHPHTTMEAESRFNSAVDQEGKWWDNETNDVDLKKASADDMIDYIDNLNGFLKEGTRMTTHATKIGAELSRVQASSWAGSSPGPILSELNTLRESMWRGYHFPTDTDSDLNQWDS